MLNETNVKAALSDTSLEVETVDRALARRYTQMFRFGQFERPYQHGEIDARAHGAISRTIGSQIAVLLKNEGTLLPLDAGAGSIVIIGQSQFVDACLGGGGSSKVTPLYTVPPLDGTRDVLADLGSSATVTKVTVADDLANLDQAKQAAADSDVVVLMAGLVATEGADQPDANMLHDQNRMLAATRASTGGSSGSSRSAGSAVRWIGWVTPTSSRRRYPSRSRTVMTVDAALSASATACRDG